MIRTWTMTAIIPCGQTLPHHHHHLNQQLTYLKTSNLTPIKKPNPSPFFTNFFLLPIPSTLYLQPRTTQQSLHPQPQIPIQFSDKYCSQKYIRTRKKLVLGILILLYFWIDWYYDRRLGTQRQRMPVPKSLPLHQVSLPPLSPVHPPLSIQRWPYRQVQTNLCLLLRSRLMRTISRIHCLQTCTIVGRGVVLPPDISGMYVTGATY